MNPLGTHLLIDLNECNPELLDDLQFIKNAMINAAVEANATIVGKTFHKFEPLGVTGIIAIAESHFCIHTWPEHSYAAADIFTCGSKFKPFQSVQLLIKSLQCSDPHIKEIKRGTMPMITSSPN